MAKGEPFYAAEKFAQAVDAMAVSPKGLPDRLWDAYMAFHPVTPKDLPEGELRTDFEGMMARLTRIKDDERGHVPATLAEMELGESKDIARTITELAWQLQDVIRSLNED